MDKNTKYFTRKLPRIVRTFKCNYCGEPKTKLMAVQVEPDALDHRYFCSACRKITGHTEAKPP